MVFHHNIVDRLAFMQSTASQISQGSRDHSNLSFQVTYFVILTVAMAFNHGLFHNDYSLNHSHQRR